jgi:hypothetical protein
VGELADAAEEEDEREPDPAGDGKRIHGRAQYRISLSIQITPP